VTADQYLLNILAGQHVNNGSTSPVRSVQNVLSPAFHARGFLGQAGADGGSSCYNLFREICDPCQREQGKHLPRAGKRYRQRKPSPDRLE